MLVNMPGPYLLRPIVASRLEKRSLCLLQVCSMSRSAEPTCHACCSWILNHTKPMCMWSHIPNNYTKWKDNMLGVNFLSRKSTFGPSMSNLQVGLSAVLCAPIETGRRLLSHPAICILTFAMWHPHFCFMHLNAWLESEDCSWKETLSFPKPTCLWDEAGTGALCTCTLKTLLKAWHKSRTKTLSKETVKNDMYELWMIWILYEVCMTWIWIGCQEVKNLDCNLTLANTACSSSSSSDCGKSSGETKPVPIAGLLHVKISRTNMSCLLQLDSQPHKANVHVESHTK